MSTAVATTSRKQVGQILQDKGLIAQEQIDQAIAEQAARGHRQLLGEIFVDLGFVTHDQVLEALAEAYSVPYAKLTPRLVDAKIVDLIPREFLEKHGVLPLFKVRNTLTVALSEPSNVFLLEEIARMTECAVQVVVSSTADIQAILGQYVNAANVFVIDDIIEDVSSEAFELIESKVADITNFEGMAGDSPVIKLVNYLVYTAVKEGASDIHIEPDDNHLRVRHRIDGVLYEKLTPPTQMQAPITSRLKIMAGLDIAERRMPQDGGIHVMMEGRPIDLRVSTLPNLHGEKVVIRIIDNSHALVSLETLGFSIEMLKLFRAQLLHPHGMILVTGPTGSGKSTTLYAALAEINSPQRNVCTVEDPIEYNLKSVNQFQVNEKIGLKFGTVLRALLRQDPDVIMVGEVRDVDTAKTAVQAALTGHLVLTTLHTNDAVSAITRLNNIGVENYLISAALDAVLAQRLIRKICPHCKMEYEPSPAIRHAMEKAGHAVKTLMKGEGCTKCHGSGYSGRLGVYELFVPDDAVREAISDDIALQELRKMAREKMITLMMDGLEKAKSGMTTVEEVFRVCATKEPPLQNSECSHSIGTRLNARSSPALEAMLREANKRSASDLLLVANEPPTIFIHGNWVELAKGDMSPEAIGALVDPLLSVEQRNTLQSVRDLDMGFSIAGLGRYRLNLHYQRGTLAAAIRSIPVEIPPFNSLGLPSQVLSFADFSNGLVLVTGGTGQGKSTTLAALIDHMNRGPARHIITVEDPVEFAFGKGTCLIEQRQVGDDSPSFASALRHVLRQRPDVILIGELRDLETMSSALTAAETGHLVLATLHTCSASQTIARMIDVFPAGQQGQVRTQLAASLRAFLCQSLLKDVANDVLVPATELMIATSAIRRMIRDDEAHLIYSTIETGRRLGMYTLEQSLESLVVAGRISAESAILAAADPIRMQAILSSDGRMEEAAIDADALAASPKGIPWSE